MEGRRRLQIWSGRVSSDGRRMAVGPSWSWKPPRGGSAVEGTLAGRGRSQAVVPYAPGEVGVVGGARSFFRISSRSLRSYSSCRIEKMGPWFLSAV